MARAIMEKSHARHLDNDDASTMSVNQYLPISHKPALAFHAHQRKASSLVANQTQCTRCGGLHGARILHRFARQHRCVEVSSETLCSMW